MREVILHRPEHGGSDHLHKVMDDLGQIASQVHKIYRTYPKDGQNGHVFLTTSKDIHLYLGQMSDDGQLNLAKLLLEEFEKGGNGELLITDPERKKGILATRRFVSPDAGSIIHLAPAH